MSSWKASAWSSSQRASGYSSFSRAFVSRALPFGVRGRAIAGAGYDGAARYPRRVADERWVVSAPTDEDDDRAAVAGLTSRRDLFQLRRPLPVEDAIRARMPTIAPDRSGRVSTRRRGSR